MRAFLLLVALLLAAASASAQDGNTTSPDGASPGEGNATAGEGDATGEGNATGEAPADAGPKKVAFTLVSQNMGGRFIWVLEGQTAANPPLTVGPGDEVTITIVNGDGIPHNLGIRGVDGEPKTPTIANEGDTQTLTFTAPESGTLTYVCLIHPETMRGTIRVQAAGAAPAPGAGDDPAIEGPTVTLGEVGSGVPAECADRPVPAIVADQVIGGPVPSDYVSRCLNPDGPVVAGPPPHPADYVIPISWLLIGLGVAGTVWVHKFYKP